jgi:hypothetical protein
MAEFREGKLWMHHDGIDRGITEELVVANLVLRQQAVSC